MRERERERERESFTVPDLVMNRGIVSFTKNIKLIRLKLFFIVITSLAAVYHVHVLFLSNILITLIIINLFKIDY